MGNQTQQPGDLVEAVAKAIRAEINRYWQDDTVEADDRTLGQAAITAMQAYMASEGVTQMECDVCHGSGKNFSHQLWPGRPCRYCEGTGKLAAHRRAAVIGKEHPDLAGHIADTLRDTCAIILGRIITFEQSKAIADAVLKSARQHNAAYAAAIIPKPVFSDGFKAGLEAAAKLIEDRGYHEHEFHAADIRAIDLPVPPQPDPRDAEIERLREALELVSDARMRRSDGTMADVGWNITKLNEVRVRIDAALAKEPKP